MEKGMESEISARSSTWQYFKNLSFLDPHIIDRTAIQSPARKEHRGEEVTAADLCF
ncbi:hypothetical protein KIN20_018491 [Parelaphostrongylus tenuis]|uniref:Uncharacterized protein n=1 Tax=Parelaphostrongylus tenuis TaxID=148309 RepID=A0AAD5MN38_PARTN|nr:hypothetical protein KIN20_018491 [Parelaphostrongylus tenuis]